MLIADVRSHFPLKSAAEMFLPLVYLHE